MQFQADIANCTIKIPQVKETTALGAAYLAGLAVGFWENQAEIKKLHQVAEVFEANMEDEERTSRYERWKKAVLATMMFK